LTRQAERKGEFVDKLVGKTTTLQAYLSLVDAHILKLSIQILPRS
jgi:hypothetical protein